MKKLIVVIILMGILLLSGCFDYNDINRMLFPTAVIVDVDEDGNPILYLEIFHAFRSNRENAESGQRILLSERGTTIIDAVQKLEETAIHRYSYSQNKMWIFTERAAQHGLADFWDYLNRHQDLLLRPYVAIYFGEPEKLMSIELKQNEYLGLFLFDLFERPLRRLTIEHNKLYEVLNHRRMGQNVVVLTALQVEGQVEDYKVTKSGAAVIKDDQLVSRIDLKEIQIYSLLTDQARVGGITIPHPQHEDKNLSLGVLRSDTKTDLNYDGDRILLKKEINIRTTIVGAEQDLILDDDIIEQIKRNTAKVLKDEGYELFDRYKEKELDIFFIQDAFDRAYPREDVKNAIAITDLVIEVNQHNEGSMDSYDFR